MESVTKQSLAQYENETPITDVKSNFLYSFSLLPTAERAAINSLYAFCSYIDDIVDSTPSVTSEVKERKLIRLDWWEKEIDKIYKKERKNILIAPLNDLFEKFNIPKQYFITLIGGCRRDLFQTRYDTFTDLKDYCYSVSGVVGLMSIEIFGYKYEETKHYAVNLAYALQLTNILRDVKHDKDQGYIYLPKEDLDRFGYSEEDLINEVVKSKSTHGSGGMESKIEAVALSKKANIETWIVNGLEDNFIVNAFENKVPFTKIK